MHYVNVVGHDPMVVAFVAEIVALSPIPIAALYQDQMVNMLY